MAEHIPPSEPELLKWEKLLTCSTPVSRAALPTFTRRLIREVRQLRRVCRGAASFVGNSPLNGALDWENRLRGAAEGKSNFTDEQQAAITKAVFENDYSDVERLKALGRWIKPRAATEGK